jgi:hypothetical protein
VTSYNVLNPLFTALGIPLKNLYADKPVGKNIIAGHSYEENILNINVTKVED